MAQPESQKNSYHLHGAAKQPIVPKVQMLQDILDALGQLRAELNEGFTRIEERFTALESRISALDHTLAQSHYAIMENSQLRRESLKTPADMERAEIPGISTHLSALNIEDKMYKSML